MKTIKLLTLVLGAACTFGFLITNDEDVSITESHLASTTLWSNYYSISYDLLNPTDLQLLGFPDTTQFVKLGSAAQLRQAFASGFDLVSSHGLYVPREKTSLLFLFNTTVTSGHSYRQETNKTSAGSIASARQIIKTSLPFGLPNYYYVSQYSLLVPRHILDDLANKKSTAMAMDTQSNNTYEQRMFAPFRTANNWIHEIGLKKMAIPLSKSMIKNTDFLLTFIFNGADNLEDLYQHSAGSAFAAEAASTEVDTPLDEQGIYHKAQKFMSEALLLTQSEVAKAVLSSSSQFFDKFAKHWVTTMGFNTLMYSTFCQVNCRYFEQSYCFKFEKNTGIINNDSNNKATAVVSLFALDESSFQKPHIQSHRAQAFKKRELEFPGSNKYEILENKTNKAIENIKLFMESIKQYVDNGKCKLYFFFLYWLLVLTSFKLTCKTNFFFFLSFFFFFKFSCVRKNETYLLSVLATNYQTLKNNTRSIMSNAQ